MRHEVSDRHLAAADKGGDAGHEAEHDREAGDGFDYARESEQGHQFMLRPAHDSEELLGAVTEEQEAGHDAHKRICGVLVLAE